ncbi:hypothetical protein [Streptomyces decoyicus]|uniref:hypothetical protein n=1 Tax=Streptomyces decoyicus TaxID=249567 RepID=UPI0037F2AD07
MNARLISAAADLICRSMKTKQTAAGIAADLDAAGMLQSPETAAKAERDRESLRALRADALNMRGALSPAGRPRRVPMPLGESLTPVVEWLLDEAEALRAQVIELESTAGRNRIAWRRARTRARAAGGAADRLATRAAELQLALQDTLGALLAGQLERDGLRTQTAAVLSLLPTEPCKDRGLPNEIAQAQGEYGAYGLVADALGVALPYVPEPEGGPTAAESTVRLRGILAPSRGDRS